MTSIRAVPVERVFPSVKFILNCMILSKQPKECSQGMSLDKHDVKSIELGTTILKEHFMACKLSITGTACSRLKVPKLLISLYCLIR